MVFQFLLFSLVFITNWREFHFSSIDVGMMAKTDKLGCEDLGGNEECKKKGEHWTCANNAFVEKQFICVCYPGYIYNRESDTCYETLGCDYLGGREDCWGKDLDCRDDKTQIKKYKCECGGTCSSICRELDGDYECMSKGDNWMCVDFPNVNQFKCVCRPGYEKRGNDCTEIKRGCKHLGGDEECSKKGDNWACNDDSDSLQKYKCICKAGYKEDKNHQCVEKNGCKDFGGEKVCAAKGKDWICQHDAALENMFACVCKPGYSYLYGNKCYDNMICTYIGQQECSSKGIGWRCRKNETQPKQFSCEFYRDVYEEYLKYVCTLYGGDKICSEKGENRICIIDETAEKLFSCPCKIGFIEQENQCVEDPNWICRASDGDAICRKKGKHWICISDEIAEHIFSCVCDIGFTEQENQCVALHSSSIETSSSSLTEGKFSTTSPLHSSSSETSTSSHTKANFSTTSFLPHSTTMTSTSSQTKATFSTTSPSTLPSDTTNTMIPTTGILTSTLPSDTTNTMIPTTGKLNSTLPSDTTNTMIPTTGKLNLYNEPCIGNSDCDFTYRFVCKFGNCMCQDGDFFKDWPTYGCFSKDKHENSSFLATILGIIAGLLLVLTIALIVVLIKFKRRKQKVSRNV